MKIIKFYYLNKVYSVNYNLFVKQSNFFDKNDKPEEKSFNLVSEFDSISDFQEEHINTFIQFFNSSDNNIKINESNFLTLYYLSSKFKIDEMSTNVEKYIEKKYKIIIGNYINNLSKKLATINYIYEQIISHHLMEYIPIKAKDGSYKKDGLFLLPMQSINRIFSLYFKQFHIKRIKDEKIIDFLFEYVKQNGREASFLFSTLTFSTKCINHLIDVIDDYRDYIDFKYVQPIMAKSLVTLQLEIGDIKTQLDEKLEKIMNKHKKDMKKMEEKTNEMLDEIKAQYTNEMKKQKLLFQKQLTLIYENLGEVKLSNDLKQIKKGQFNEFQFTKISIPSTVQSIESSSFENCPNLKVIKMDPNVIKSVYNEPFKNCKSIKYLIMDVDSNEVGIYNNGMTKKMKKIIIQNNITSILPSAFIDHKLLTKIILPSSITSIGESAFKDCVNLVKMFSVD